MSSRPLWVLLAVFLGACRSAGMPAAAPAPVSDGEVSWLERRGAALCGWHRLDAVTGRSSLVAQIPASCDRVSMISWSPDRRQALVTAGDSSKDEEHAYSIRLADGNLETLETPPGEKPTYFLVAFDTSGRTLALTETYGQSPAAKATVALRRSIEQIFPRSKVPAALFRNDPLYSTYAWKRGWTRTDHGEGATLALHMDAWSSLSAHTRGALAPMLASPREVETDPAILAALGMSGTASGGTWLRAGSGSPGARRLLVFEQRFSSTTLPLTSSFAALLDPAGVPRHLASPALGGRPAAFRVRGRWLLVSRAGSGTHPRLYDLRDGRLAWFRDDVELATFWPGPTDELSNIPGLPASEAELGFLREDPDPQATPDPAIDW